MTEKKEKNSETIIILICLALFFIFILYYYFQAHLQAQKCLKNIVLLNVACEMYSKEKDRYPDNIYQLTQNGYIKEILKCPKDNCEYKFISKYIKNNDKAINDFIIYCPNHALIFDSSGLCSGEKKESIKNGKISDEITLTDEELKQLGFK